MSPSGSQGPEVPQILCGVSINNYNNQLCFSILDWCVGRGPVNKLTAHRVGIHSLPLPQYGHSLSQSCHHQHYSSQSKNDRRNSGGTLRQKETEREKERKGQRKREKKREHERIRERREKKREKRKKRREKREKKERKSKKRQE